MEKFNTIEVKIENRIGLISLNRPQVLNAINEEMVSEVTKAMIQMNVDESVACIILKGNGVSAPTIIIKTPYSWNKDVKAG